jgi:hypothetical protein
VLEAAGLLRRAKDGRVHRCRLETAPIVDAARWIDAHRRLWRDQLDRLARHLERAAGAAKETPDDPTRTGRPPRR